MRAVLDDIRAYATEWRVIHLGGLKSILQRERSLRYDTNSRVCFSGLRPVLELLIMEVAHVAMRERVRAIGRVAWFAMRDYAVPATFIMLVVKMKRDLPTPAFYVGVGALVAYVLWRVVASERSRSAVRKRLAQYEALMRLMTPPLEAIDQSFAWHTVNQTYFFAFPDAIFSVENEGANASTANQDRTTRTIAGDSPIEFAALGFKAFYDLGIGERSAAVSATALEQGRKFQVAVSFPGTVVRPGQSIKLRYECRWPNTVALNEDYVVFTLRQFAHPVGRLIVKVGFPTLPASYHLVSVEEGVETPIHLELPTRVSRDGAEWQVLTAEITRPTDLYLLRWRRN